MYRDELDALNAIHNLLGNILKPKRHVPRTVVRKHPPKKAQVKPVKNGGRNNAVRKRSPNYVTVIPAANATKLPEKRQQDYVVFVDDTGKPVDIGGGGSSSVAWADITGKPATLPLQSEQQQPQRPQATTLIPSLM